MTEDHREQLRITRDQAETQGLLALPPGPFTVILADPPWHFQARSPRGEGRSASNHYPTMDTEAICALPVGQIAAPDCLLALWATTTHLHQAFSVIDAWGFRYVSSAVWAKPKIGLGFWFRNRHELVLLATRGHPGAPPPSMRPASLFFDQAEGGHSAKPETVHEMLESWYPVSPRVELFARRPRPGWTTWGTADAGLGF